MSNRDPLIGVMHLDPTDDEAYTSVKLSPRHGEEMGPGREIAELGASLR